jgi:hypothetical protein
MSYWMEDPVWTSWQKNYGNGKGFPILNQHHIHFGWQIKPTLNLLDSSRTSKSHSWDSLHCDILNSNYSMLLSQPWLCNASVIHDWGNNLIIIEGNVTMWTIVITKHLDNNTKCLEVLMCYNLMEGVRDEKEIVFATKPNLFTLGTITLPEMKIFQCYNFWYKS